MAFMIFLGALEKKVEARVCMEEEKMMKKREKE